MAYVEFTSQLQRFVHSPRGHVTGSDVRSVLESVFDENPRLRGYILDDQGRLRAHVMVFVDGGMLRDREGLTDALSQDSKVYVMQALSGG